MEEKYITRLLTFSNEILMGNYETISLNRKNVKELLKEIHTDYIPVFNIEKKIEELREKVDGDDYWKYTEKDYLGMQYQIEVLQELLNERNNTDE